MTDNMNTLEKLIDKCSPQNPFSKTAFQDAEKERLKMMEITNKSEEWYYLSCRLGRYEIESNPNWPNIRLTGV